MQKPNTNPMYGRMAHITAIIFCTQSLFLTHISISKRTSDIFFILLLSSDKGYFFVEDTNAIDKRLKHFGFPFIEVRVNEIAVGRKIL